MDPDTVEFATLGTNLFHALRLGQVDAGMVQEPSLSMLTEQGASLLFNAMDLEDAEAYFGGAYEFMGVSVRRDEPEIDDRLFSGVPTGCFPDLYGALSRNMPDQVITL